MYNKIDIEEKPLKKLLKKEVVFKTQNDEKNGIFVDMALENQVFWPHNNFSPSEFVAYYFTEGCKNIPARDKIKPKTISHFARIRYIFHNVTIDELKEIDEFIKLPTFESFLEKAHKIYHPGNPDTFAIAITDEPIELPNPIEFKKHQENKLPPRILPTKKTTLSKLLTAKELEDLV